MLTQIQPLDYVDDTFEGENDPSDMAYAIGQLSPEYREVLVLVCVKDFSYETVSELLNLPVLEVRSRLGRARNELMSLMANPMDGYSVAAMVAQAA